MNAGYIASVVHARLNGFDPIAREFLRTTVYAQPDSKGSHGQTAGGVLEISGSE